MDFTTLIVEVADAVAVVTINRPEKRNALNAVVRAELLEALAALREDPDARVVVVTGAGDRAFVAGADVGEFAARTAEEQRGIMSARSVFDELASFPKPTIAMINGYAFGGGCELALACDLRIAAASARLGQPEVKLGLIPGGGATQRLPRLVGPGQALRLILTGEPVSADEALRIGLVELVVADGELRERTLELARGLARQSPVAMRLAKQAVGAAEAAPGRGLSLERDLFIEAFASRDGIEGVRAFMEKRPPVFGGT
jgi:enoyl-CoA hydratase